MMFRVLLLVKMIPFEDLQAIQSYSFQYSVVKMMEVKESLTLTSENQIKCGAID